jgi:hypothetical protein
MSLTIKLPACSDQYLACLQEPEFLPDLFRRLHFPMLKHKEKSYSSLRQKLDRGRFSLIPNSEPSLFAETMKHAVIRWNPATKEHFCTNCGRTSVATNIADAQEQLEQYDCQIPSAETPRAEPGIDVPPFDVPVSM